MRSTPPSGTEEPALKPWGAASTPVVDPERMLRDIAAAHDERDLDRLLPPLACMAAPAAAIGLAALVRRLPVLPQLQRANAFGRLLAATWDIDVDQRWRVLQSLTRRLHAVPAHAAGGAFLSLLEAAMALPPEHAPDLLETLINRVGMLPEAARLASVRRIVDELPYVLRARRGRVVWCLARELATLAPSQRQTAMAWLLWITGRLDSTLRGTPLVGLCWALPDLPLEQRWSMYRQLLREAGAMPALQARAPLSELAAALAGLPEADRTAGFEELMAAVACIPAHDRWEPAARLARTIEALVDRPSAFGRLVALARQLPAETQAPVLEALAFALHGLPLALREHAFDAVLALARALPQRQQSAPLHALADHALDALPAARRPDARRALQAQAGQPEGDSAWAAIRASFIAP